jgi:hypothetical protein
VRNKGGRKNEEGEAEERGGGGSSDFGCRPFLNA